MIIKVLAKHSQNSQSQVIHYLLRYSVRDGTHTEHKEQATIIQTYNLRRKDTQGMIAEFQAAEANRLYKRKNATVIFHSIISFSPHDKSVITDHMLKNISKKYIELRGKSNLYLSVRHSEKLHEHLHILCSGVQLNGRSSRQSKQQFASLKAALEQYQQEKYPELEQSAISHEKIDSGKAILAKTINARHTKKAALQVVLDRLVRTSSSLKELETVLGKHKRQLYYRNGKAQGILDNGIKYRFSRLGIDPQKLKVLQERESIKQTLQQVRVRHERTQERSERNTNVSASSLQDIRARAMDISSREVPGLLDRDIELPRMRR